MYIHSEVFIHALHGNLNRALIFLYFTAGLLQAQNIGPEVISSPFWIHSSLCIIDVDKKEHEWGVSDHIFPLDMLYSCAFLPCD